MFRSALLTLILILTAPSADASTSSVSGRVLDSTGAPLPGVTVEVSLVDRKTVVEVTDLDGRYSVAVPAGEYALEFSMINFATAKKRVMVDEAPLQIPDIVLYLSSSAEVVVTARNTFRNLHELSGLEGDLLGLADSATVGVVSAGEIASRAFQRPGEILETVPGLVVSQHSGEGKANQYYLRGYNLDHGSDLALRVAALPLNMPTHAHGQGYADSNFLIPELIGSVQFKKGTYFADEGDFASAGAANISYVNVLDEPIVLVERGRFNYTRMLGAGSSSVGGGHLLYAGEWTRNDGPWERPDQFNKRNGILRYSFGDQLNAVSVTGMLYEAEWDATDQIPQRGIERGEITRFGHIDPTNGGRTHRRSLSAEWQRNSGEAITSGNAYVLSYGLDLFSNFTYFLEDPERGDQFEQVDDRTVYGGELSHRWRSSPGWLEVETSTGVQLRRDAIDQVGLYHTAARRRLETIREDEVDQSTAGVYLQSSIRWSLWLRTVTGLRYDHFWFDVSSNGPENSGRASAAIVSPKLSLIFGPWRKTELYVNGGRGFHSNDGRGATMSVDPRTGDPADAVDPLVPVRAAEIGIRTAALSRIQLTAGVWALDVDSELLFVGDAGTTEASRPARRRGMELEARLALTPRIAVDADLAWSRARFSDANEEGNHVPGAVEGVASVALRFDTIAGTSGSLRYRYFGPRPLVEDNSVRSRASSLFNLRLAREVTSGTRLIVDVLNLLDSEASDVDYYYTSRLRNEVAEGRTCTAIRSSRARFVSRSQGNSEIRSRRHRRRRRRESPWYPTGCRSSRRPFPALRG